MSGCPGSRKMSEFISLSLALTQVTGEGQEVGLLPADQGQPRLNQHVGTVTPWGERGGAEGREMRRASQVGPQIYKERGVAMRPSPAPTGHPFNLTIILLPQIPHMPEEEERWERRTGMLQEVEGTQGASSHLSTSPKSTQYPLMPPSSPTPSKAPHLLFSFLS